MEGTGDDDARRYRAMRGKLGTSSAFRSDPYRRIEFLPGNKHAALLTPY